MSPYGEPFLPFLLSSIGLTTSVPVLPPQAVRELNFENSRLSNYKLHCLDLMYYHLIVGNYCHMTGMNHQTNLQIVKFQTCGL